MDFDIETQKKIEEEIRLQNVMANMENAIEYNPEAFGSVIMLYIDLHVNGFPVKAFVDSGAQATIISPELAEKCNIMRLIDTRFQGIAKGVGTAKILGRIHAAPIKLGKDPNHCLNIQCSFTVLEGKDVDMLLGLDNLKRFQACIDLAKNVLRIHDVEIPFLSEADLPDKAKQKVLPMSPTNTTSPANVSTSSKPVSNVAAQSRLVNNNTTNATAPASTPVVSNFSEDDIGKLMALGATRQIAIQSLEAAQGNLDVAASFIFNL